MLTTSEAAKVSEPSAATTKQSRSAQGATTQSTVYPARSRGSISGLYAATKLKRPNAIEGSTWGWAERIHFSPEAGYEVDD